MRKVEMKPGDVKVPLRLLFKLDPQQTETARKLIQLFRERTSGHTLLGLRRGPSGCHVLILIDKTPGVDVSDREMKGYKIYFGGSYETITQNEIDHEIFIRKLV